MKHLALYAVAATSVAAALHFLASVPWGWAALAAFVGWPIVGTLITSDDDLPGGFSNPDGTVKPEWLQAPFWAQIFLGLGIAATVAVVDTGWSSSTGQLLGLTALLAFCLSGALFLRCRAQGIGEAP